MRIRIVFLSALLAVSLLCSCDPGGSECGPTRAKVIRVIDGDTVELQGGERVRYLMIDTPESTGGADDCFGQESKEYNSALVLDRTVRLSYDVECRDRYDRLLAYVYVDGVEVNSRMVEYGYACVLHIPPNGDDRETDFKTLQAIARSEQRGMWGACEVVTCD